MVYSGSWLLRFAGVDWITSPAAHFERETINAMDISSCITRNEQSQVDEESGLGGVFGTPNLFEFGRLAAMTQRAAFPQHISFARLK